MNIALPTFLIFLAVVPGFVFLRAYRQAEEHTSFPSHPLATDSGPALFVAMLLHTASFWLFKESLLSPLLHLLTGGALREESLSVVPLYFLATTFIAYLLGCLAQWIVLQCNPYKSSRFSFNMPWYYELKGKLSGEDDAQMV